MLRSRTIPSRIGVIQLVWLVLSLVLCSCSTPEKPLPPQTEPIERPSWSLITSGIYHTVAVGDLNGDLKPDIVGGSTVPGSLAAWLAAQKGRWMSPYFLPVKGIVASVTVADFNKDGRPDLAFSIRRETQGVRFWVNKGNGTWEEGPIPIDAGSFHGVTSADINKDGTPDLIAAAAGTELAGTEGYSGIKVWLGDGRGGWREEVGPTAVGQYHDVIVADFDEDGNPDIVGSGYGPDGALRIWLGNARGGWSEPIEIERGTFYRGSTADINHDRHMDLLVGSYRKGIKIFYGDGDGGFRRPDFPINPKDPQQSLFEKGSFFKVLALESEGKPEIIASSLDFRGIQSWQLDKGQLIPLVPYAIHDNYYDILLEDLDGDGVKDLMATSDGGGIRLWLSRDICSPYIDTLGSPNAPVAGQNLQGTLPVTVQENEVFKTVNTMPLYRIGPGDTLEITSWKGVDQKVYPVLVNPDGKISFSFVQDLTVQGLTIVEIASALKAELMKYVREPLVDVRVRDHRSKFYTVFGEIFSHPNKVSGPGTYPLKGRNTVLGAISDAGGYTDKANLQQVTLRRKSGAAFTLNLYQTITRGDVSQDPIVEAGDTIIVPTITTAENKVYVFGEINKPGVYTITRELSLVEAIALAGSYTDTAVLETVMILRGDIKRPEILSRDLKKLLKKGDMSQNLSLQAGDVVYVPRTFLGDINVVLRQIVPLLQAIVLPAQFADSITTFGQ